MRKLSEITGTEGMEVIGGLLPIVSRMIKAAGDREGLSAIEFAGRLLQNDPDDAIAMLAVVDGKPVEEYQKKNFLEVLRDVTGLLNDDDLMGLFGLQMQTKTSSTSASENSEVTE